MDSVYPMFSTEKFIKEGDTVIVLMTRENQIPIVVTKGQEMNNRFGIYHHTDFIGVPFGTKFPSRNKKGFVYLLRPTPELWTLALPHRTQILYIADIAYILSELDVKPGAVVVEAGTGSGSFSHSVCRAVAPHGTLYSFEFHETRAEKARLEFESHGMSRIVKPAHRNVCKDGFGLEDAADAVFLDLPAPWEAIASAKTSLKKSKRTRICCFSPCIEQVLKTVAALTDEGFTDITMSETLIKPYDIQPNHQLPSISTAIEKLSQQEVKREERRLMQIEASKTGLKRKIDDAEIEERNKMKSQSGRAERKTGGIAVTKPMMDVRGHTSYLTFATLLPVGLRGGVNELEGDEAGEDVLDEEEAALDAMAKEKTEDVLMSAT